MARRITRAMSRSHNSSNTHPQITDAANLPVTQSLLDASTPSSPSASAHASISSSTLPSVPTDILQCMLDAINIQQQQFDKQYELLEARFLAQQQRDATLLRQLQLISPPQLTESAPNPFDSFAAASPTTPVPASTPASSPPSVPDPAIVPVPTLPVSSSHAYGSNTSSPFDSVPVSVPASTTPFDPASVPPLTPSHAPPFAPATVHASSTLPNPFDVFPRPSASPSTTFVTKSEVKELTFPEFTNSLGYEAWYNMAMRTAADHPDFAPFVSTSIDRLGTVKRSFVDPMPVHIRERLFRILASSLKNVWKTVSLRPDEVHLRGDRILQRFTHEFGTSIDDPLRRRKVLSTYHAIKCGPREHLTTFFARFNDLLNVCIANNLVPNDPPDYCFHFLEKVLASNRFCTVVANDLSSIMVGILRRHDPTWYHPDGLVSCKRNLDRFLLAWESIQVNPSRESSLNPSPPIGRPKPPPMNPPSTREPFSDSDRLAFIQRKDFITRLINQNDSCQLASLHRQHPNGCFLHKHPPCSHRLLECRTFLALANPNPSIVQAIQRELKSSNSTSARYASSEGGSPTNTNSQTVAPYSSSPFPTVPSTSHSNPSQLPSFTLSPPKPTIPTYTVTHVKPDTAVCDSGATDTMTGVKHLFSNLYRFPRDAAPTITLGDNSTIHAAGWGILDYIENTHRIRRIALFVPQLHSTTLLSISRHVQYADCSFHAENNQAILTYPNHTCPLSLSPELHSTVTKTCDLSIIPSFDETTAAFASNADFATSIVPSSILDHVPPSNAFAFNNDPCQVPSSPVDQECDLPHLRDSNKPCVNKSKCVRFARQVTILRPDLLHVNPDSSPAKEDSVVPTLYHPQPTPKPKPRPWDHVPSSAPTIHTLTPDRLLKSIGFLSSPKIQKGLLAASQPTISILDIDKNPSLDPGETASLKAASRNTTQSPLPSNIGDLYHCDIGFGPTKAIGGVMYSLLLVDKKSRYKLVYPLQNLTSDLLSQLQQFLIDVDGCCKAIRTDFDHKLLGGNVKTFLLDKGIDIDAAPPRQQHKNGLVERSWQGIVKLSRNWLASACLPPNFWWFAIKRAT